MCRGFLRFHNEILFRGKNTFHPCFVLFKSIKNYNIKPTFLFFLYFPSEKYVKSWFYLLIFLAFPTEGLEIFLNTSTCGPRYMRYFTSKFVYMRLKNLPFSVTYRLIYSNPWSFYMRIRYVGSYYWSTYLSLITRETFILECFLKKVFMWRGPKSSYKQKFHQQYKWIGLFLTMNNFLLI